MEANAEGGKRSGCLSSLEMEGRCKWGSGMEMWGRGSIAYIAVFEWTRFIRPLTVFCRAGNESLESTTRLAAAICQRLQLASSPINWEKYRSMCMRVAPHVAFSWISVSVLAMCKARVLARRRLYEGIRDAMDKLGSIAKMDRPASLEHSEVAIRRCCFY